MPDLKPNQSRRLLPAAEPTAAPDRQRGPPVMERLAKVAHEHPAGVPFVTPDHRTLDISDRIPDGEDGAIRVRKGRGETPGTAPDQ